MENTVKANDCSCPSCGAAMRYRPEIAKLFCENCQTSKDILCEALTQKHDYSDMEKHSKKTRDWQEETKNLKCPNCGANVVLNKLQYSSSCPYCESNLVSSDKQDESIAPDGIIPFLFSDQDASKKYVEGLKKKWFLPNKFKKSPPVESIHGVYVPIFGFDSQTTSRYVGRLAKDHTTTNSKGERRTYTTYQNISGVHNSNQRDVLVETSSKLNQNQFAQIQPYYMQKAVQFKQGFIMGYTVEHYQNTVAECKKVAEQIMMENIKREILSRYHYDRVVSFDMSTAYTNQKYMYYLVPVYKCDYKFKEKTYTTFMNGQTGKVGGGVPRSGVKIFFFVLMWVLIIAGIIVISILTQGD
ncbi:MAG: hypothetical protein IJ318_02550 [Clostridia bacterium]|nr:hypothetical protein [Clostridia bacterium]